MTELTEDLLLEAAVFVAQDSGSPGFLRRFTSTVAADAGLASQALDRALAARTRAGNASITLGPGDLRVETTSTGGRLTACAREGAGGGLDVTLHLVDAEYHAVPGAAVRVQAQGSEWFAVTNPAGWVTASGPGESLIVQLGSDRADEDDGSSDPVVLPRIRRYRYELAAAHSDREGMPDEPARWRITVGPVAFECQDRAGGYDLTLLIEGVPAAFAESTAGAHAVHFVTWDREGHRESWLVPLSARPLGLGGCLYGTDADRLDPDSVRLDRTEVLLRSAQEHPEEMIRRSVWHSDSDAAWVALRQRLGPGRHRSAVDAALAERENAQ